MIIQAGVILRMKGDAIHNHAGIEDATPGCLWWSSTCTHSASKASLQGAFCSVWGRTKSSGPLPGGQQQLFCKVGSHMLVLCSHCCLVMEPSCCPLLGVPSVQLGLGSLGAGVPTHGCGLALLLHLGSWFERVMSFRNLKNGMRN